LWIFQANLSADSLELMGPFNTHLEKSQGRLDAIDQFRGFAILLMVLADYLSRIQSVPAWLKHAPSGVGLTVVDLIAPMFIFSIGLVYRLSLQRRLLRDGNRQAILHFIRRFLALIGIGTLTPWGYSWGLFQTIGGAGLLSLLVIWMPSLLRLIIGVVVLGGYQVLLINVVMERVPTSSWCEMEGTLSWAAMLILASVLADLYNDRPRGRRIFFLGNLASLGLGIVLSNWVDVSQYYVSASYALMGLGASGVLFAGFHVLTEKLRVRLSILIAWGKNPLMMYLLHYWIWVIVFLGPQASGWHIEAPVWLIVLQASGFVGVLTLVAWFMDRRGWIVSL
jgi:predicted acyltransferase